MMRLQGLESEALRQEKKIEAMRRAREYEGMEAVVVVATSCSKVRDLQICEEKRISC